MPSLPIFPEGRGIRIEDKPLFDSILKQHPPELSAYTFTNLFAWGVPHGYLVGDMGGEVIVFTKSANNIVCLEPLGSDNTAECINDCTAVAGESNIEFKSLHTRTAQALRAAGTFSVELDRDNSDYLYATPDLADLPGRKYDAKRNFVNRLKTEHQCDYIDITLENVMECHDFAEQWCEERVCDTSEGLAKERCAVYQMLWHFASLDIKGGALIVDGKVSAFSLGEMLNPQTLVVHVEKADSSVIGAYQLINNEFCKHEAAAYDFVNREQDLGIPGLTKAKKSYHPVRIIESYQARPLR